jgi:hypothetical protein
LVVIALLGSAAVCGAQAAERPAFHVLRFEEDWSAFSDGGDGEGRIDALKHVVLDDHGNVWLSFGGQLRERVEAWNEFNFGATPGADSEDVFLLSRLRAHADLHLGRNVRVFAEMISALATDRDLPGGRRTSDVDELDLENGFLEVNLAPADASHLRLRAGRQELLFGQQRLVSPLDWSNTRRQFDGATLAWSGGLWSATGFWSRLVDKEKYEFNDTDEDNELYGIYATARPGGIAQIDLYWLALRRKDAAINGSTGDEDRHTLGARVHGRMADTGLDYDVEAAWQGGEVGAADVNAGMVSLNAGTDCQDDMRTRFELGFDYASGDDDPGDGDVQTFNQLFPLGHKYLGHADVIGRQNVVALRASAAADVVSKARLGLDLHYFRRASNDDAVYNAGGGVLRPGTAGGSNDVGVELDLSLKLPVSAYTLLELGYSHFFAGKFIDQAGPSDDIDFAYLSFQYTL